MLWTKYLCSPAPNAYVEILMPNITVLHGGALGRWSGHKGSAFERGISVLTQEAWESPLAPSNIWRKWKDAICEPDSGHLIDTGSWTF